MTCFIQNNKIYGGLTNVGVDVTEIDQQKLLIWKL